MSDIVHAVDVAPPVRLRGAYNFWEFGFFIVCALAVALVHTPYLVDLMILTFLWAGLALAWNIAGGYAGLISFGHAAFFGIGAYTSSILLVSYEISPWIGALVGAVIAGLFGAILTLIFARLRGPFFILSTLATAEVVRILAMNLRDLTGGAEGLSIPPVSSLGNMVFASKGAYAVLTLGYFAALFLISKTIERSRLGYDLCAARDDEAAASAAGVDPLLVRTLAMTASAALTGVGGTLFAQYFLYLDPTQVISPDMSFQIALLPAFGGIGTAVGPVLGAFVLTPLAELLRGWLGNAAAGLHLVIYGLLLIVLMLKAPGGLLQAFRGMIQMFRRGRAT
jgi:branched-chain amino acid transport system permease protein